jgi:hypothetical protein
MLTFLPTLLLLLQLLTPEPATTDLVVTLRDEAGAGIADAAVVVRAAEGEAILATARTDREGQAQLSTLSTPIVRVLVRGQLPTGVALTLSGQDAAGIRVFLDNAPVRLDLRVADEGRVVPDVTMFVEERAGAVASAVPIVPLNPLNPLPPAPTVTGWSALDLPTYPDVAATQEVTNTVVGLAEVELPPASSGRQSPLLLVLVLLCLVALALVLLVSRRRAP